MGVKSTETFSTHTPSIFLHRVPAQCPWGSQECPYKSGCSVPVISKMKQTRLNCFESSKSQVERKESFIFFYIVCYSNTHCSAWHPSFFSSTTSKECLWITLSSILLPRCNLQVWAQPCSLWHCPAPVFSVTSDLSAFRWYRSCFLACLSLLVPKPTSKYFPVSAVLLCWIFSLNSLVLLKERDFDECRDGGGWL